MMSPDLTILQLAIHYIDKHAENIRYATDAQHGGQLHPTIADFLLALVGKVWFAPDTGSTRSGHFKAEDGPHPSLAKPHIAQILHGNDCFFNSSQKLAEHLYQQTPATASPGLLAVLQLGQPDNGQKFVSILKIRHKDENFVKILDDALTQLKVEHINNLLLEDIQKGAVIPHPQRGDYDLKVVDKQAANDPAIYFTDSFLGCIAKKSDEHQIKRLLPELREYAEERGLPFVLEKLPQVVTLLQQCETNITTAILANTVKEQKLYGPDFKLKDFEHYINYKSSLGAVDIPRRHFIKRGKIGKTARNLTYYFHDPEFRGVTISGPPQVLANIFSVSGDTVTFRLNTTRDGYDVRYE